MAADLLIAGIVLLFALAGLSSGATGQLIRWAGLGLGFFASGPLARLLTPLVAPRLGLSPMSVQVVLSSLCFMGLYMAGAQAALWPLQKLIKDPETSFVERGGGFVLGAGKAAVALFVLLSAALFFEKPYNKLFGEPPPAVAKSRVLAFVRAHNLFDEVPVPALARLETLMDAVRRPASARDLARDPTLRGLLDDPALKATLSDDKILGALKSGDWSVLRDDPRITALLNDPRLTGPAPAPKR